MDIFVKYLGVVITGGLICVIAQILIDKTKLTSARILVLFVVSGVFLSAFGVYEKIKDFGHCGATVPLVGFGHALYQGVVKAIDEMGFRGIFTGGLPDVAGGIVMAVFFGVIASLVSKPKSKKP
ncbi:MAG: SpoVA/SpoVAEb family sporulation membrane protein [Ruminococcaceae bacterium]|nr:SpoVA/SpoVAEb family sporulation membrane protein [Oscillospiraceae bacterium]